MENPRKRRKNFVPQRAKKSTTLNQDPLDKVIQGTRASIMDERPALCDINEQTLPVGVGRGKGGLVRRSMMLTNETDGSSRMNSSPDNQNIENEQSQQTSDGGSQANSGSQSSESSSQGSSLSGHNLSQWQESQESQQTLHDSQGVFSGSQAIRLVSQRTQSESQGTRHETQQTPQQSQQTRQSVQATIQTTIRTTIRRNKRPNLVDLNNNNVAINSHQNASTMKTITKAKNLKLLKDIRRLEDGVAFSIPRGVFGRAVKEIAKRLNPELKFQSAALLALQNSVESYLVQLYERANFATLHAKRVTLFVRDMQLVRRITGEDVSLT